MYCLCRLLSEFKYKFVVTLAPNNEGFYVVILLPTLQYSYRLYIFFKYLTSL